MRLCTPFALAVVSAAAVAVAAGPIPGATAAPDVPLLPPDFRRPTCAPADTDDFPVHSRIHGGPASYHAGGDHHTWSLDLTNTTSGTCRGIHPVIVLVDEKRALLPTQPRLDFYTGTRPHPVAFERTDADELVGVLDHDGFPGFTVPPGRTLTVKLRLAVASGAAVPNDVVANAAVVQRRGNDGEWVGESNDYRFRILDSHVAEDEGRQGDGEEGGTGGSGDREDPGTGTDTGTGTDADPRKDPGTEPRKDPGTDPGKDPGTDPRKDPGTDPRTNTAPRPDTAARDEALPWVDELAQTGASVSVFAIGMLLLATGAVLVAVVRWKSR